MKSSTPEINLNTLKKEQELNSNVFQFAIENMRQILLYGFQVVLQKAYPENIAQIL